MEKKNLKCTSDTIWKKSNTFMGQAIKCHLEDEKLLKLEKSETHVRIYEWGSHSTIFL